MLVYIQSAAALCMQHMLIRQIALLLVAVRVWKVC